jgi:hypothetical protein
MARAVRGADQLGSAIAGTPPGKRPWAGTDLAATAGVEGGEAHVVVVAASSPSKER